MINTKYKYSEVTSVVIGCAMQVHKTLGSGSQEVIYQRALEIEMDREQLKFAREFEMPIYYREQKIGGRRVDFLVQEVVSVELKAVVRLEDVHLAQALNYLEAYNLEIGLLLNFGARSQEPGSEAARESKVQTDAGLTGLPAITSNFRNTTISSIQQIP